MIFLRNAIHLIEDALVKTQKFQKKEHYNMMNNQFKR
ncbi:hypothetical protein H4V97_002799 [Flavobacterium sp. CG_23.5]|nr:hypothetical protein [Flavobacterium sp. CG_9.10]MBP2284481.1 hypothetical protein [Flavobacterium sp. CG_23.5]